MTAVRLAFIGEGARPVRALPRHAHRHPLLIWYTRGRGWVELDDGTRHAFSRDTVVGMPGGTHYREWSAHGFISLFIALEHLALPEVAVWTLGPDPRFRLAARLLLEEARRSGTDTPAILPALAALMQAVARQLEPATRSALVREYLELVHVHASDPAFTLAGACRRLQVTPRQLRVRVQSELGTTPLQQLTGWRIAEAERLLAGGGFPVQVVAERCGFTDAFYFARAFRRRTGLTPSAWRQAHRR